MKKRRGGIRIMLGVFILAGPMLLGTQAYGAGAGKAAVGTFKTMGGAQSSETISDEVTAACTAIEEIASESFGVRVRQSQGPFMDPHESRERYGCILVISGSFSDLHDEPGPRENIRSRLPERGWEEVPRYAADGPNGTAYALSKDDVLCIVQGKWAGADDSGNSSESRDVQDEFEISVGCTLATK